MPNIGGPSRAKRALLQSVAHSRMRYAAPSWATTGMKTARNRQTVSYQYRDIGSRKSIPDGIYRSHVGNNCWHGDETTVNRKFIYTEKKEHVIAKDKTTNIKKKNKQEVHRWNVWHKDGEYPIEGDGHSRWLKIWNHGWTGSMEH